MRRKIKFHIDYFILKSEGESNKLCLQAEILFTGSSHEIGLNTA